MSFFFNSIVFKDTCCNSKCFAKIEITLASPISFFVPESDNAFLALAVAKALNSYTSQPD